MINFSPQSKIWIYQSNRAFTAKEAEEITALGKSFVASWASHGNALSAHFEMRYDRFLILAVDENAASASGCSIDKSVAFVKQLEQEYKVDFFDRMLTAYRSEGEIKTFNFSDFSQLLNSGELTPQTIVFNNLVFTKEEFEQNWETQVNKSWLSRFIP
jgi:hypothetical protein